MYIHITIISIIIITIIIIISRAPFRPSSPNYGDVFVNDAARQRLRIN